MIFDFRVHERDVLGTLAMPSRALGHSADRSVVSHLKCSLKLVLVWLGEGPTLMEKWISFLQVSVHVYMHEHTCTCTCI